MEVGFGEDALAEVRRAEGAGEFGPRGELLGNRQEVLAVAGDEFFSGTGTVGQRRGEAEQDFGGGGGIGEGAVGRKALSAEVVADGGEVVTFEIEEAAGEVEGVVPRAGGKRDSEAGGVGVDHREIERDIVADEHRALDETGELVENLRSVAAMRMQGFLADAVDGGGIAERAGGTKQGLELSGRTAGDEFHRADVDYLVIDG